MGIKVDSIDVDETVKTARKLLEEEQVSKQGIPVSLWNETRILIL